jgi:excinuclease UvrABC nuclease subunit
MSGSLFDSKLKRMGFVGEAANVYWLYDKDDTLLYVGSTVSLRIRVRSHSKIHWWPSVKRLEIKVCETVEEAREVEKEAIWLDRPRENIVGQQKPKPHRFDILRRRKDRGQSRLW